MSVHVRKRKVLTELSRAKVALEEAVKEIGEIESVDMDGLTPESRQNMQMLQTAIRLDDMLESIGRLAGVVVWWKS